MVASGLVGIRNYLDAVCSAEGDNVVLFQQTARYDHSLIIKKSVGDRICLNRYLLKAMQQVEEDNEQKIDSSVAYFNASIWSSTTIINLDDYCRLFESRSHL